MANQNITTKETISQLNDADTLLVVQNSKLRRISKKDAYGDEVSQLKEAIVEQTNNGYLSKNLANPNNFVIGKVVNYKDGSIESNSSYFISNYIAVKPNTTYTKQGFTQGGENWCYASDKSAISRIPSSGTFTTPSNAKYVILSGNTENIGQAMLEEGTVASSFIPYAYPNTEIINVKNSSIDLKMLGWTVPTECPIQNSYANGVFTQRVGRVDLGSLSWSAGYDNKYYVNRTLEYKKPANNSTKANAYSDKYTVVAYPPSTTNKSAIAFNSSVYEILIPMSDSTPSGYLYYELATPITKNIDGNEVVSEIQSELSKYTSFANLGVRSNADVSSSDLSEFKNISNCIPYMFVYSKNGLHLVIGYHYANAEYGSQMKLSYANANIQARTLNNGTWSSQW